jgi:hypothetical protein
LELGVGLELMVGLELGVGLELIVGLELGVGLEVELGMGVIVPGLHVKPGDSIHGVGLATEGLLHCRLNFTELPFSVNKSVIASGICWLRVSLVLP